MHKGERAYKDRSKETDKASWIFTIGQIAEIPFDTGATIECG